ncbi:E3 ubiquitin-protein ligase ZNRF2 [Exaiptasia diaphana]|uniref:E3 ubiquitin-protein ligase ZNRF1 n=1 Tax=Exaiptasia diaphana TaxID=2652724 RepID=A0A913WSA5_EXADI|nr:E3 ubiquitin-protein ligase ZNRF2 [Exaiptasia diaphana]XP_020910771.1 E3 ubiquitin-protein ligase ZNRF2 [Exaiptasia diaphana]KXJ08578.1 E3 ubiquitin-protein ligase ZNRF2 [Exaiptasia diaphana]KXJ18448.1 E3 ubiquitin-protein ligase ZNRF2 [Exaiptasia diaphana]
MGGKQSTETAVNNRSTARHTGAVGNGVGEHSRVVSLDPRIRTRSLNSVDHSFPIPSHQSSFQESGLTANDDNSPQLRGLYTIQGAHSLPAQLFATSFITGVKCPVCSKVVISEDIELHLVVCLTKPRLSYNEDVLQINSEECAICLDDMRKGETIARLPCLCIYHKCCIDLWFQKSRTCPEHPS